MLACPNCGQQNRDAARFCDACGASLAEPAPAREERKVVTGAQQTSKLARRVAAELKQAGWRLERVLCDNGNEFRSGRFRQAITALGGRTTHIKSGRPQTNGHVEALHRLILEECWRPAFARYLYPRYSGLKREPVSYLQTYNFDRVHHRRLTAGRIPADIVYGARKMETRSAEPVGTSR